MVATLNFLSILKLKLFTIQPANGGWRRLLSHISLKWQLNIKAGLQLNKHMSVATTVTVSDGLQDWYIKKCIPPESLQIFWPQKDKNYSVRCFTFMQAIAQPKNPDDFWLASQV